MKGILKKLISSLGIEIQNSALGKTHNALYLLDLLRENTYPEDPAFVKFVRFAAANARKSHAQLFQDLFVLSALNEKRGGYFVEFGATDGVFLSNTLLLERDYGWRGILAEPSINWHDALKANRQCLIDTRCVWSSTGEKLSFSQAETAELSTVTTLTRSGSQDRSKQYDVETISLNDLLLSHKAPKEMDYLSIDTEGSELTILQALDFSKWHFSIITVEHNFNSIMRKKLFSLLSSNGYELTLKNITLCDDWYIASKPGPL